ncbi:hypothetical protein BD309DRAFT_418174 [Dichomitus squalens]|nr:hypothetical protein BD309DRAFT_418174 [Dichomitus squalens]
MLDPWYITHRVVQLTGWFLQRWRNQPRMPETRSRPISRLVVWSCDRVLKPFARRVRVSSPLFASTAFVPYSILGRSIPPLITSNIVESRRLSYKELCHTLIPQCGSHHAPGDFSFPNDPIVPLFAIPHATRIILCVYSHAEVERVLNLSCHVETQRPQRQTKTSSGSLGTRKKPHGQGGAALPLTTPFAPSFSYATCPLPV